MGMEIILLLRFCLCIFFKEEEKALIGGGYSVSWELSAMKETHIFKVS